MNTTNDLKVHGVTYRLQFRKCGKAGCRCNTGEGHGPYWYAFSDTASPKYIGVTLPEHVTKHIELLKASASKLKAIKAKIIKRRNDAYAEYSRAVQELDTIGALEAGEHADSKVLAKLGLSQFNGHK